MKVSERDLISDTYINEKESILDDLTDIPKPKVQTKKPLTREEIRERLNKITPPTGWKEPNTFLKYYFIPLFLITIFIIGAIGIFILKSQLGFLFIIVAIFYGVIVTPVILGICGYMLIRLIFFDKNKITGKIISNVSRNYFIMYFLKPNKRISKRICLIEKDGISILYDKSRYIIDSEKTWLDDENRPSGFWLPGLPQQLGFDFAKYLISISNENPNPTDNYGHKINIMYNSKNLEFFKNDKLFYEFHQQVTPETMKLLTYAFIIIGIMIFAIVLIVILTRK